jgi:hypothetical protein
MESAHPKKSMDITHSYNSSHLERVVALEGSLDGRVGGGVEATLAVRESTPAAKKEERKFQPITKWVRKVCMQTLENTNDDMMRSRAMTREQRRARK